MKKKKEVAYFAVMAILGILGFIFWSLAYKVYDYSTSVADGVMIISGYAEIQVIPMIVLAVICVLIAFFGIIIGLGELD